MKRRNFIKTVSLIALAPLAISKLLYDKTINIREILLRIKYPMHTLEVGKEYKSGQGKTVSGQGKIIYLDDIELIDSKDFDILKSSPSGDNGWWTYTMPTKQNSHDLAKGK